MEVDSHPILSVDKFMEVGERNIDDATLKKRLVFSKETSEMHLMGPTKDATAPIFFDRTIYEHVKTKLDLIGKLKADLPKMLLENN